MGHRQPKDPTDSPTRCPRSHLLGAEWLGKQEAESPAVESECIRTWEEGGKLRRR